MFKVNNWNQLPLVTQKKVVWISQLLQPKVMKWTEIANTPRTRFPPRSFVRLLTPVGLFLLRILEAFRVEKQSGSLHMRARIVCSKRLLNPATGCGMNWMLVRSIVFNRIDQFECRRNLAGRFLFSAFGIPGGISIRTSSRRLVRKKWGKWKWPWVVAGQNKRCFWWFLGYYKS